MADESTPLGETDETAGESRSFLDTPAAVGLFGLQALGETTFAGTTVGAYRVLEEIGRGGTGTVYVAERSDGQFQHRVAIKLIRHGLPGPEIHRRFLAERQILARLNHPNIARFFDAGTTAEGVPYCVLELVEGVPIDRYCEGRRLGLQDRLRLFLQVCHAVSYAHRNLVVHRDLKPANILVTDEGAPKLLDFGIAKIFNRDELGSTSQTTVQWLRLLTPDYASPEQVSGRPITTASDVYSLGVLLYRLLTGALPYRFPSKELDAIQRTLEAHRPLRPSDAVAPSARETAEELGAATGMTRRALRGDLDAIVMKALRTEPEHRYPSVEQLIDDLRRYALGLPVRARRDRVVYRLGKFVRRRRASLAATLLILCLVVAFSADRLRSAAELAREQRGKAQVAEFMLSLFDASGAGSLRSDTLSAREILDRGAARVAADTTLDPPTRAALNDAIGQAYTKLGAYRKAIPQLEIAVADHRLLDRDRGPRLASSLHQLAIAQHGNGDYEASQENFEQALILRRQLQRGGSREIAETLHALGALLRRTGAFAEAAAHARQALQMRLELPNANEGEVAASQVLLGTLLSELGEVDDAEGVLRTAIATLQNRPDTAGLDEALVALGGALLTRGRAVEAEPLLERAIDLQRELLGERHTAFGRSLELLAGIKTSLGEHDESLALMRQVAELQRRSLGEDHPLLARTEHNLGAALYALGRLEESEAHFRRAVELASRDFGEDHPRVGLARTSLARTLHELGRLAEAEAQYRRALAGLDGALGANHLHAARAQAGLADVLTTLGQDGEAVKRWRGALAVLSQLWSQDDALLAGMRHRFARSLSRVGELGEAEELLRLALPVLEAQGVAGSSAAREALVDLNRILAAKPAPG